MPWPMSKSLTGAASIPKTMTCFFGSSRLRYSYFFLSAGFFTQRRGLHRTNIESCNRQLPAENAGKHMSLTAFIVALAVVIGVFMAVTSVGVARIEAAHPPAGQFIVVEGVSAWTCRLKKEWLEGVEFRASRQRARLPSGIEFKARPRHSLQISDQK
jgi:hypothetical protein